MPTEHHLTCNCGLEIILTAEDNSTAKIYCKKCQQTVFPLETEVVPAPAPAASAGTGLANPRKNLAENDIIDDYRVVQKIGKGGMGEVFLCRHQATGEQAVIKILTIDMLQDSDAQILVEFFIREAQILQSLDHPHIVKFKGCGNFNGAPYVCMEYLEGKSLEKILLTSGGMKLSQALPIVFHVVLALEYAEQINMLHRDVKPANIILQAPDYKKAKLIDFGVAKVLGPHYQSISQPGMVIGTLQYMPPEQLRDSKSVDHRADIYALGATLYHMLAGVAPYREFETKGKMAMVAAISQNKLTPLEQARPGLPKELYQITAKAMAFRREDRFKSAREFKECLKSFTEELRGR